MYRKNTDRKRNQKIRFTQMNVRQKKGTFTQRNDKMQRQREIVVMGSTVKTVKERERERQAGKKKDT